MVFGIGWTIQRSRTQLPNYDPIVDGGIESIAVQPDGKILIGGTFATIAGTTKKYIVRLNPDGTLDDTFDPNADSYVFSIAVQPDRKILAGGYFTTIGGAIRNHVTRLNPDGTVDATFNPNVNASFDPNANANFWVESIVLQSDRKILVGGRLTAIGGPIIGDKTIRLNPDGTVDTTFDPKNANANFRVSSRVIQPDRKVLVITTKDGKISRGGESYREKIARLNPDGTVDITFNSNVNANFWIKSIALQSDGKILIGGYFSIIGKRIRHRIARLNSDGTVDSTFKVGK